MDEVTSYLFGKIKKSLFFTVPVIMVPVWCNLERRRIILKDVGAGRHDKMIRREWPEEQPTERFVNICIDYAVA
jgi:hypothetical protein